MIDITEKSLMNGISTSSDFCVIVFMQSSSLWNLDTFWAHSQNKFKLGTVGKGQETVHKNNNQFSSWLSQNKHLTKCFNNKSMWTKLIFLLLFKARHLAWFTDITKDIWGEGQSWIVTAFLILTIILYIQLIKSECFLSIGIQLWNSQYLSHSWLHTTCEMWQF